MEKLILVSNRLPYTLTTGNKSEKSVGGLVSGLLPLIKGDTKWIGWHGGSVSDDHSELQKWRTEGYIPVSIPKHLLSPFYDGYINGYLWAMLHGLVQYAEYKSENWEAYVKVNKIFADAILANYSDGDEIWVHDFQLMMVPGIVRNFLPQAKIAYFSHIPFPNSSIWNLIPESTILSESIDQFDYIGFHTERDVNNFRDSTGREAYFHPLGVDVNLFEGMTWKHENRSHKTIFSVERLDYIKGIRHKLQSFDLLLTSYPHLTEKVVLKQVAVPSRENVFSYMETNSQVFELVDSINDKYGTEGWKPVDFITKPMNTTVLYNEYNNCDVFWVNSLADGMNLTAKEFILARQNPANLVLSRFAGASEELDAYSVNPYKIEETADIVFQALAEEPVDYRFHNMKSKILANPVSKWGENFLKCAFSF